MAAFLSPAWIDALDAAARARGPLGGLEPGTRLVLASEVHMDDGSVVTYQVVFEPDGISVHSGTGAADLTIVADYPTAVALARGETNAQHALTAGNLRLRGDVERFAAGREALLAFADCFADVRAATAF